ncbi:MAG: tagaturonate epimerase family protein [Planctomycetota bacterium]
MAQYQFGRLRIDPARNPAVLDTATWDPNAAWDKVRAAPISAWPKALAAPADDHGIVSVHDGIVLCAGSWVRCGMTNWSLGRLNDGQYLLLAIGARPPLKVPRAPIGELVLTEGERLIGVPADAEIVDWFVSTLNPDKGPKALGAIPRLGIGTRMSTSVWPSVWPALTRTGLAANTIQNSVRELNVLGDLLAGRPAESNFMFGFGTLYEGHTGSTFEGLWLAGVLAALESGCKVRYGADADHIMVKRTPDGLDRARRVIDAARRYTFYTLDVSDILDYEAIGGDKEVDLAALIASHEERQDLLAFHTGKGGPAGPMTEATVACMVGKYAAALSALAELAEHIRKLKRDAPFDLELSIDETPPGVNPLHCTTTEEELSFLLGEIRRRGLPVTHIAPNFGVEKGVDYRGADGLAGLGRRVRGLYSLANEEGILLDCHSGDDLTSATRRTVGAAAGGDIHFKISPVLQLLFAKVLHEVCFDRFLFWWEDTMAYVREEAGKGSELAARCLRQYEESGAQRRPSPSHPLFHYYSFATVGRRDAGGQFVYRERFYDLPTEFGAEYTRRVTNLLGEIIGDLFYPDR